MIIHPSWWKKINLDNNLTNITPKDRIFQQKYNYFRHYTAPRFSKIQYPLEELAIASTDLFYQHYSLLPKVKQNSNPNSFLEKVREAMLEYQRTPEYQKARALSKLDSSFSEYLAWKQLRAIIQKIEEEKQNQQNQGENDENKALQKALQNITSNQLAQAMQKATASVPIKQLSELKSMMGKAQFEKFMKKQNEEMREKAELGKDTKGTKAGVGEGVHQDTMAIETLKTALSKDILEFTSKLSEKLRFYYKAKIPAKHGSYFGYKKTSKPTEALAKELALPEELF